MDPPPNDRGHKRRREQAHEDTSVSSPQRMLSSCFEVSHSFIVCLKCSTAFKANAKAMRNHCNRQHHSRPPSPDDVSSLVCRAVASGVGSPYDAPFDEAMIYPPVGLVKVSQGMYCSRCQQVRAEGAKCKDAYCSAFMQSCSYQSIPCPTGNNRFVRVAPPVDEQDNEPAQNNKLGVPVFSLQSQVGRRGEDSNTQEKLWRLFSSYASRFRKLKGGALSNEYRTRAYQRVQAAKQIHGRGLLSIDGLVKVLDALVKWGRQVADAAPALLGGRLRHDKRVFVSGSDGEGPAVDWGGDEDSFSDDDDNEEEGLGEDAPDDWTSGGAGGAGAAGGDYSGGSNGEPFDFDYGAGVGGVGADQLAIAETAAARQGRHQESTEGVDYEAHVPSNYLQRI